MSAIALGNPENYTIGGLRFYFAENKTIGTDNPITAATILSSTLTIAGDHVAEFAAGSAIRVSGSTGNDGDYVVLSATLDGADTDIVVDGTLADATADGDLASIRSPYLYLGNVTTGEFSSDVTFLDHFTAKSGTRTKDRSIVQEISVNVNLTLDEPNAENMNLFMLGGDITSVVGTPGYKKFAPYTKLERNGGAKLGGVSDTGNEWIWFIRNATLKPDGSFSYNDQDWSSFSMILDVLKDSVFNVAEPFGVQRSYGVGENIEQETDLLP